jgi:hypothetical protein
MNKKESLKADNEWKTSKWDVFYENQPK